jgi:hypothetical protein
MKYIFTITLLLISSFSFGGQDFGKISKLYIDVSGIMAIQLDEGFPTSSNLCTSSNGWAYVPASAPPEFKSLLLAAKAAKARLQVSINECVNGNSLQLHAVTEI